MSSAAAQQSHIKTNSICHTHTLLRRGLLGPSLVLLLWGRRIFSRPHTYPLMPHLHARILNSASLIVLRTSGKSGKNERQCSLFEHSHQGRRLQLRGSRKKRGSAACRPRDTPKTLTTQGPTSDVLRLGHRRPPSIWKLDGSSNCHF